MFRTAINLALNNQQRWPFGTLGDLIINSGNVNIDAGQIYDYRNVYIETGATLTIVGDSIDWTCIGVRGFCILKGSILGKAAVGSGIFTITTPDFINLNTERTQGKGGNGYGYSDNYGAGSNRGGGGGGVGNGPYKASIVNHDSPAGGGGGGETGSAQSYSGETGGIGGIGGGGKGANAYGNNAANIDERWSGSGGGSAGKHGMLLYMRVKGVFIGTGGIIDLSGQKGGNGGNNTIASCGGGAAGGNGGFFYLLHAGSYIAPTINVSKGLKGTGGVSGSSFNGTDGANGSEGTEIVSKYE